MVYVLILAAIAVLVVGFAVAVVKLFGWGWRRLGWKAHDGGRGGPLPPFWKQAYVFLANLAWLVLSAAVPIWFRLRGPIVYVVFFLLFAPGFAVALKAGARLFRDVEGKG